MLAWRHPTRTIPVASTRQAHRHKTTRTPADAAKWTGTAGSAVAAPRGSTRHHDLATFLKHVKSSGLSERSTVYVGTHYEYSVMEALKKGFGFSLTRTGRSSDLGIDLVGHWSVPSLAVPLRVILQCKASSRKLAPENVRELEGAFAGAPAGWRGGDVLGFLVAGEAATKGMRDAMARSSLPLGFMQIGREGGVRQVLWNHVAAEKGLGAMGVTLRHTVAEGGEAVASSRTGHEVVLTYKGRALEVNERRKRGRPRKTDTRI